MPFEIFALEDVECSFGNSSFTISWRDPGGSCIVAAAPVSNISDIRINAPEIRFESADCGRIEISSKGVEIQHFVVVGISGLEKDSKPSAAFLSEECRKYPDKESITCCGISTICRVVYNIVDISSEKGNVSQKKLFLRTDSDIPAGFLCYAYTYLGKRFMFPINRVIKSSTVSDKPLLTFRVPVNVSDCSLEAPGTQIKLEKNRGEHKLSKWLSRHFPRIFGG
ncbi:MAG: hypothetical protein IJ874_03270 [Ruminococcus sp.]|nr:hypothetical protein [Ruminococcus sp.]